MFKASKITEQRLYELEVPEITETYKPADYKELLHIVKSYNFGSPVTVYSNNGGLASNIIQEFDMGDNELQGVIQITNSYDKTRAFRLRVGAKVKVCGNGMFSSLGDTAFYGKHYNTASFNPYQELRERIKKLSMFSKDFKEKKEKLKAIPFTKEEMKLDLLACVLNNTMRLPVVEYKRVFKQIENPLYNYHSDETKWEYYNHFTYVLKSQNIFIVDTSQDKLIKHFEL